MELLQQELAADFPELKFVSYSVDPTTDTLPALAEYAQRFNALPHRWYLVRGSADSVYNLARSYLMNAGRAEDGPFHDNRFVLVDKHLRIRGFYQAIDEASPRLFNQVEKLKEQLRVLYLEHRDDTTSTRTTALR
jgi:protein SCO1/2